MTPATAERINKMHRGQSCTSVMNTEENEDATKKLERVRSSSFDKSKKPQTNGKKRNPKKKLNLKQSSLAQHFSLKNKFERQNSNINDSVLADNMNALVVRNVEKELKPLKENKGSIQNSSRSYFRLGKNVERNHFKEKSSKVWMPTVVKGADKYLKSRSKPIRASVKLAEIRPMGLNGVSVINQSKCFN